MERRADGTRKLSQPNLIKRILDTVGISKEKKRRGEKGHRRTPAMRVLNRDLEGQERRATWDYRSVIGMLNWLTRSTRADILFATSQVARFVVNPKHSHELAVIRICEYLRDTQDEGMIFKPNDNGFEVYADADFCGGYDKKDIDDPSGAKSRTAYNVMYNGCLIHSHSKLQTEHALSTTEAEYICLSQALRSTLVIMRLFKELSKRMPGCTYEKPTFRCVAWEDNAGALALANSEGMKPRTKHINLKYHHFKSAVKKGIVEIKKVDTKEQIADIGTKPLDAATFEYLRHKLLGW